MRKQNTSREHQRDEGDDEYIFIYTVVAIVVIACISSFGMLAIQIMCH